MISVDRSIARVIRESPTGFGLMFTGLGSGGADLLSGLGAALDELPGEIDEPGNVFVSEPIATKAGVYLYFDVGHLLVTSLDRIPTTIAAFCASQGVDDGYVTVAPTEGPLRVETRTPEGGVVALLMAYPSPPVEGAWVEDGNGVPEAWLATASHTFLERLGTDIEERQVFGFWPGGTQLPVGDNEVLGILMQARGSYPVACVRGAPEHRMCGIATSPLGPMFLASGTTAAASEYALESDVDVLKELARQLPQLAYATIDVTTTYAPLMTGLPAVDRATLPVGDDGRPLAMDQNAWDLSDEAVVEANWWQRLSDSHIARLGPRARDMGLVPSGDRYWELQYGTLQEWMPGTTVSEQRAAARRLLDALLVPRHSPYWLERQQRRRAAGYPLIGDQRPRGRQI